MFAEINWLGVLLAAVGAMAVGSLWYSPVLFAKAWQAELGKTMDQLGNPLFSMINAAIMFLIAATGLSVVFRWAGVAGMESALATAAIVWVFFAATMQLLADRFQGLSIKLSLITAGNTFCSFLTMGAIIQALR